MKSISLFWHRRDLRVEDNHGLFEGLNAEKAIQPIFIFDTNILDKLEDKSDRRVTFIHQNLEHLKEKYQSNRSDLWVFYGNPLDIFKKLASEYEIKSVHTNADYEPYALERDEAVAKFIEYNKSTFHAYKDHVFYHKDEVLKADDSPYTVFTPYSRRWKARMAEEGIPSYASEKQLHKLNQVEASQLIALEEMGFTKNTSHLPERKIPLKIIRDYHLTRDIPSIAGTSKLSLHLRFGTISIRKLIGIAENTNEKWLNELIWRDFYQAILHHFPHVVHSAFKAKYNHIPWRNNEEDFVQWCNGKTGIPIVDAGMRELNATGFMHNRVRMIVASFLTKNLLINWQWGEAYFAAKLNDFELGSNNGGWQWAASTGCDAAPYFRVFNPESQAKKFDSELKYIKKWVPEFQELTYAKPMVDLKSTRKRAIEVFKEALS